MQALNYVCLDYMMISYLHNLTYLRILGQDLLKWFLFFCFVLVILFTIYTFLFPWCIINLVYTKDLNVFV